MSAEKLPTEENPYRTVSIDNWPLDKLSAEYRAEANRERDGYYMNREQFKQWWKEVVQNADH